MAYNINVEKLRAENLAIPFRTLNIGRFSDGGDENSRKSSNFVLVYRNEFNKLL